MRSNNVIRRNFLTLLLKIPNSREKKISSTKALTKAKAKEKAISRKNAKITHFPGKKMIKRKKTYSLLNTTIVVKWVIILSRVRNQKRVKKTRTSNLKN
jgi:hypothetical protein